MDQGELAVPLFSLLPLGAGLLRPYMPQLPPLPEREWIGVTLPLSGEARMKGGDCLGLAEELKLSSMSAPLRERRLLVDVLSRC